MFVIILKNIPEYQINFHNVVSGISSIIIVLNINSNHDSCILFFFLNQYSWSDKYKGPSQIIGKGLCQCALILSLFIPQLYRKGISFVRAGKLLNSALSRLYTSFPHMLLHRLYRDLFPEVIKSLSRPWRKARTFLPRTL